MAGTKKKAAPKAKARDTILIETKTTMLDGEVVEGQIEIVNPRGCMLPSQASAAGFVIGALKAALAAKFGVNHVK